MRLMGVPTSEVGYTAAMPRREDHEVHKDMWWGHWTIQKKIFGEPVNLRTYLYTSGDVFMCSLESTARHKRSSSTRLDMLQRAWKVIKVLSHQAATCCTFVALINNKILGKRLRMIIAKPDACGASIDLTVLH